jgi:hypothetical protein
MFGIFSFYLNFDPFLKITVGQGAKGKPGSPHPTPPLSAPIDMPRNEHVCPKRKRFVTCHFMWSRRQAYGTRRIIALHNYSAIKSVAPRNGPQGIQLWAPWGKHLAWSWRDRPSLSPRVSDYTSRSPACSVSQYTAVTEIVIGRTAVTLVCCSYFTIILMSSGRWRRVIWWMLWRNVIHPSSEQSKILGFPWRSLLSPAI